jgi:hypothetical protein
MVIQLTVFTKSSGILTKVIALAPDGSISSDASACVMARGTATRIEIDTVRQLADLIENMPPNRAIALGALRSDLPNAVKVISKDRLAKARLNSAAVASNIIARTGSEIVFQKGQPAFALLDFDRKGMPANVAAELETQGGFWAVLVSILPALKNVARVTRPSTSAGLHRLDTGERFPDSGGLHVYLEVRDGDDIDRFLTTVHERAWLAGLGWMLVSSSGALLERSIVDRMVGGPERLVFEGAPVLVPPLQQDKESRHPIAVDGVTLDTVAVCPPLSIVERARLNELKTREHERLAPETAKAREAFVEAQAKKLVARTGVSEKAARQVIVRQCEGVLRPDIELPFDDPELAGRSVGDVLADPERFEDETLADPLEGVSYGRCVAKVMRRPDGTPWIHSFAHGRTTYKLKHDAASVRKTMEKEAKDEVVATFALLAAGADIDAVELGELRQLAKKLSGIGLWAINDALKSAKQQQAAQNVKAARARQAASRQDTRPQIQSPFPDEPFLPVMAVLNEVIGQVGAARPPSRDIDDDAMRVRKLPVPNTHAFSSSEVNIEPEEKTDD